MIFNHLITASRIIVAPICLFYLKEKNLLYSALLTVYAIFTDWLDGYLARKFNKQSNFGAIFDVVADKFFLYCLILGIYSYMNVEYIIHVFFVWLLRDTILTSLYFFFKVDFKSLMAGKIYTVFQFIFILSIILMEKYYFMSIFLLKIFILIFLFLGIYAINSYYKFFKIS